MDDDKKIPRTWEAFLSRQELLPVVVKSIERIHDATWSMTPNRHDCFEMVYMKRGGAMFVIEGAEVPMTPNDLIIIKPHMKHKLIVRSEENCEFLVLSFLFEKSDSGQVSEVSMSDFIEFVNTDQAGAYIHLCLTRKNDIATVLDRIVRERENTRDWDDIMIRLLLLELFVLISRTLKNEWEMNVKSRTLKMKELLHVAKEYIDTHYNEEMTLSDVAKYVFLSESYFAHRFKNEFNISPKSYLLKVRVEASKKLLAHTDMKISDVALSVGFSSQQRYNDIFRKYVHTTPLKYRVFEKSTRLNKEF